MRWTAWVAGSLIAVAGVVGADDRNKWNGPCAAALDEGAVCEAANQRALELMRQANLAAVTVVQDVRTGSLFAFAASDPAKLDVTTPLAPLSTVKLMLAASWWDHRGQADELSNHSVSEMLVSGNDNAGRRIVSALREKIGTETLLKDLQQYGFVPQSAAATAATNFWAELAPQWKERLRPAATYHLLNNETSARDWEDTLSIGEARFTVTALNISRFLQAIGNGGVMIPPKARGKGDTSSASAPATNGSMRIMQESTASNLQAAMRAVVERGTAKHAAEVMQGTGWQIGGKTGTGPGPQAPGPESDGWFAGLIFDPQGTARFTVATFVRHGGLGGGNAARISAELARFLSVSLSQTGT